MTTNKTNISHRKDVAALSLQWRWRWQTLSLATAGIALLPVLLVLQFSISQAAMLPASVARLGLLDKITGKFSIADVEVGHQHSYQSAQLRVRACLRSDPLSAKESVVFIEIDESVTTNPVIRFRGWMLASSPGISTLQHPLIDIWLVECRSSSSSSSSSLLLSSDGLELP